MLAIVMALAFAPATNATNGMYLLGYGAEVIGRGGANIGVSDRSLALNFNPAGISQLQGRHFTLNLAVMAPKLQFQNMVNGPTDGEDNLFPLPAFAYVHGSKDSKWSWGVGFIAQGGMGAEFNNLNTFFGTVDDISSEVRFGTLSPTVAYAFNEDMAIGATLNIGYGDVAFSFFPDTSFFNMMMPEMSFFGMDMEPAGGLQSNLRLGWWWRAHPKLSIGLIYQTETDSNFEDGDMTVDFTGHPFLGQKVKYSADVTGFTDKLHLAIDVKRYYWDRAIDTIEVTATNPSVMGAPPEIVVPFVFDWEDQWIFAAGFDYRKTDRLTLRAGYNFSENPVPDETLNPLFPATVEHHITLGFGYLSGNKTWDFALERALEADYTNNNPNPMVNPFGPGSQVKHSQWTVAFGLSWALDRK
jgi:long-chain fatty acid transport protein